MIVLFILMINLYLDRMCKMVLMICHSIFSFIIFGLLGRNRSLLDRINVSDNCIIEYHRSWRKKQRID